MKIQYKATRPFLSHALRRIEDGLKSTLPDGFELTQLPGDLAIIPVVNIDDTKDLKQPYIIWQLCHKTAEGTPDEWIKIWNHAAMVVSYLNLPYPNYLRLPLGYDPLLFHNHNRPKEPKYDIVVTGYVDEDKEGEVIARLCNHFDKVIHIGQDLKIEKGYTHAHQITDTQLAEIYRNSRYVAGMRMIEGFELPIIEGAACGCQPITLNLECYRYWFNNLALFVHPDRLDEGLAAIAEYKITNETSNWTLLFEEEIAKFTWEKVMREFWNTFMNGVLG
jgi:glycosyltransferase involved in cell wall biosynthesis